MQSSLASKQCRQVYSKLSLRLNVSVLCIVYCICHDQDLSDVRIGIFPEWFADATPEIHARCSAALAYLTSRGATVVNITVPHLQIMSLAHAMVIASEFALGWDQHFHNYPDRCVFTAFCIAFIIRVSVDTVIMTQ